MNSPIPFNYHIGSTSFLGRANERLVQFDLDENPVNLFYAALELRFGIEARLNEYLNPVLTAAGKNPKVETKYAVSKLLKRLIDLDPQSNTALNLRITSDQTMAQTVLEFTPVSPKLAALHGQLGKFLHYSFFVANDHWYLKVRSEINSDKTIRNVREILQQAADELTEATRGALLAHPRFTEIVQDIVNERV